MERVDIEALVGWAYRVQCVDRMAGLLAVAAGRVVPGMRSASDTMAEFMVLGCRVDSSPRYVAAMGAVAQDDALTIHDAVLRLPAEAMALVVAHARSGSRPPWHSVEAERLVADTDAGGRYRMMMHQRRAVACQLRHVVDPALVAFSRAQYAVWWEALDALAGDLKGRLDEHEALPPQASRTPWFDAPLVYVEEGTHMALDDAPKI